MDEDQAMYTETIQVCDLLNNDDNNSSDDITLDILYTEIPQLTLPFLNYYHNDYKLYYLFTPFFSKDHINTYTNLNNSKMTKIGVSMYQEFPSTIKNKYESEFHKNNPIDYQENTLLWLHPFKNPNHYNLIDDSKNYFFNFSNFFNVMPIEKYQKTIDIVIICDNYFNIPSKHWLRYYHNISLINKVLPILSNSKLNITIIDTDNIVDKYYEFNYVHDTSLINSILDKSKICIVFNKHASFIPYIGNALLRNNVILMYHSILGEWNLINKYTGKFFSDTKTLLSNIEYVLNNSNKFKPKKWYLKKHDPQKQIQELYHTITKLYKKKFP